jgi:glycosyltransferase involved in cell wall biosynthesis
MTPTVSILVPTLNAAKTIDIALHSIERAVEHAPDIEAEVLVIDGGSSDATCERVARRQGVRLLKQQSRGLAAARNEAIAATSAPLIAFCDADDAWTDPALHLRISALVENPSAWGITGGVRFVDRSTHGVAHSVRWRAGDVHPGATPGAMLLRRCAVMQIGPFDTELRIGSDADWILRAEQRLGSLVSVDAVVLEKGLRGDSLSTDVPTYRREMLTIAQ